MGPTGLPGKVFLHGRIISLQLRAASSLSAARPAPVAAHAV
jgi:hypothetical protein